MLQSKKAKLYNNKLIELKNILINDSMGPHF